MLSTTASYAIRALSCLANVHPGQAMLGRELAEMADVPANYLGKILLVLKNAGYVEATRGTGGGYRLSRSPDNISLMQLVELFDPQAANDECLLDTSRPCNKGQPCPVHERWNLVKRTYQVFLQTTTLREVAGAGPSREEESDDRSSR